MKKMEMNTVTSNLNLRLYSLVEVEKELTKCKRKLAIAEQKVRILEDMIENRTRDLHLKQAENKELEMFSYVASHDLQEPLRTVNVFVELLAEDYRGQLDEQADKYIDFISKASTRMSRLVKDLLDYSKLGSEKNLEEVDCDQLVNLIIEDLGASIKETKAKITCRQLPVINAYPTEIKLLFQNLISNAIKFKKKEAIPMVMISAERENDYWKFSVRDNGIGMKESHTKKIFEIFQRLHGQSEYEGTGIGLTHCKKIAELHGGKIWVNSTKGKGSTFYFTIRA